MISGAVFGNFIKTNSRIIQFHTICRVLFTLIVNFETWDGARDGYFTSFASLRVEIIIHNKRGKSINFFLNKESRIVRCHACELLK